MKLTKLCRIISALTLSVLLLSGQGVEAQQQHATQDGPESFALGQQLFHDRQYEQAAAALWRAVILHGNTPPSKTYDVQEVFQLFMQCYLVQDRLADGLAFVSVESFRRGQTDMGRNYLQQALSVDPNNEAALAVQEEFGDSSSSSPQASGSSANAGTASRQQGGKDSQDENEVDEYVGKTPEQLYGIASEFFAKKNYESCADVFELSCERSLRRLGPSCANAVYCRGMLMDWGFNGTVFEADMKEIIRLTEEEVQNYKVTGPDGTSAWRRSTSVHPHMMLGYPVDPLLKREVTESTASLDELMARSDRLDSQTGQIPPLPSDMPFSVDHQTYVQQVAENPNFRIRVGFVGSGFNSKAVLFLSQDMFRFFDKSRFEVHIFSFGPPDSSQFIHHGMRGVDWRERVKSNVHHFHDCQGMKMDHIKAARYIHDQDIHILIEWDGYARQGKDIFGHCLLRDKPYCNRLII